MKMTRRYLQAHVCKKVLCTVIGLYIFVQSYSFIYGIITSPCVGPAYTEYMCLLYDQGILDGSLCEDLCLKKTLQLSSCQEDSRKDLVFPLSADLVLRVKRRPVLEEPSRSTVASWMLRDVYAQPASGSSMQQFRQRATNFLIQTLGDGDHSQMLQSIVNMADVNNDDKVSLAEAKTIWALLQRNDFFIHTVFSDSGHVPKIKGFCGENYATEHIPNTYLYKRESRGVVGRLLHALGFGQDLDWRHRAKIAVGLLEVTLDALQHGSSGGFHFCKLNESNIGYTKKYDVKLLELGDVLSLEELSVFLGSKSCRSNLDCQFTEHCSSVCDKDSQKCSVDLVRPNLFVVCMILGPYLLQDIPEDIQYDYQSLMHRCNRLDSGMNNFDVEHALVLNDLKSLLWQKISAYV